MPVNCDFSQADSLPAPAAGPRPDPSSGGATGRTAPRRRSVSPCIGMRRKDTWACAIVPGRAPSQSHPHWARLLLLVIEMDPGRVGVLRIV